MTEPVSDPFLAHLDRLVVEHTVYYPQHHRRRQWPGVMARFGLAGAVLALLYAVLVVTGIT